MAAGIILAGGRSRRMGRDKAALSLAGETLLQRTARVLTEISGEVLVAGRTGPPGLPGVRALPDSAEGSGPLAGLVTGLRAISAPYALVVACDLPFLDPALLRYLLRLALAGSPVRPESAARLGDGGPSYGDEGRGFERAGRGRGNNNGYDAVIPVIEGKSQTVHAVYARSVHEAAAGLMASGEYRYEALLPLLHVRWVEEQEIMAAGFSLRSFTNVNTPEEWRHVQESFPAAPDGPGMQYAG